MKLVLKDKEGTPVKDATIAIEYNDETDDGKSDDKGEFTSKLKFNVGTKVTVKLTKENFKQDDSTMEFTIGDGNGGNVEQTIEFPQNKV